MKNPFTSAISMINVAVWKCTGYHYWRIVIIPTWLSSILFPSLSYFDDFFKKIRLLLKQLPLKVLVQHCFLTFLYLTKHTYSVMVSSQCALIELNIKTTN